jgi:hypothetical protein
MPLLVPENAQRVLTDGGSQPASRHRQAPAGTGKRPALFGSLNQQAHQVHLVIIKNGLVDAHEGAALLEVRHIIVVGLNSGQQRNARGMPVGQELATTSNVLAEGAEPNGAGLHRGAPEQQGQQEGLTEV